MLAVLWDLHSEGRGSSLNLECVPSKPSVLALSFAATSVLVKPESFQPSVIHPDPDKATRVGPDPLLLGAALSSPSHVVLSWGC